MIIERPTCPACGSEHTRKIHGPSRYGPWMYMQRHGCVDCGRKFATLWQGEFFREYESRAEVKEKKPKKKTMQLSLPGMTCAS